MADIRDVQPVNPIWPKKSTTQKRRQQQSPAHQQQKSPKKSKRDRYGRGHIDEFA